jgi:hypothetical protein
LDGKLAARLLWAKQLRNESGNRARFTREEAGAPLDAGKGRAEAVGASAVMKIWFRELRGRVPLPGMLPEIERLAEGDRSNRSKKVHIGGLFAVSISSMPGAAESGEHFFAHAVNGKSDPGERRHPMVDSARLEQAAFPFDGLDFQLGAFDAHDLAIDIALEQQFPFALAQFV